MTSLVRTLRLLAAALSLAMAQANAAQLNVARVLIYSATRDFRHDSIPTAVDALVQLGPSAGIAFDHTEDQTWFIDETLAQYDAVLFLSNTGEGACPPPPLSAIPSLRWKLTGRGGLKFWMTRGRPRSGAI